MLIKYLPEDKVIRTVEEDDTSQDDEMSSVPEAFLVIEAVAVSQKDSNYQHRQHHARPPQGFSRQFEDASLLVHP